MPDQCGRDAAEDRLAQRLVAEAAEYEQISAELGRCSQQQLARVRWLSFAPIRVVVLMPCHVNRFAKSPRPSGAC